MNIAKLRWLKQVSELESGVWLEPRDSSRRQCDDKETATVSSWFINGTVTQEDIHKYGYGLRRTGVGCAMALVRASTGCMNGGRSTWAWKKM